MISSFQDDQHEDTHPSRKANVSSHFLNHRTSRLPHKPIRKFTLPRMARITRIKNIREIGEIRGHKLSTDARPTSAVRQGGASASSMPQNGEPALACTAFVRRTWTGSDPVPFPSPDSAIPSGCFSIRWGRLARRPIGRFTPRLDVPEDNQRQ